MSYGKLPSGACGLIRSLRVSRLANRHDTESDISPTRRYRSMASSRWVKCAERPVLWRLSAVIGEGIALSAGCGAVTDSCSPTRPIGRSVEPGLNQDRLLRWLPTQRHRPCQSWIV